MYGLGEYLALIWNSINSYVTGSAILTGLLVVILLTYTLVKIGVPLAVGLIILLPLALVFAMYGLMGSASAGVFVAIALIISFYIAMRVIW